MTPVGTEEKPGELTMSTAANTLREHQHETVLSTNS